MKTIRTVEYPIGAPINQFNLRDTWEPAPILPRYGAKPLLGCLDRGYPTDPGMFWNQILTSSRPPSTF